MRRLFLILILLIGFLGVAAADEKDWETIETVPTNAIATAIVTIDDTNPAMQNLFRILLNDYFAADIPSFLQQNILFLLSGDVAITMTGAASADAVDYAIVTDYVKDRMELTLPVGDVKVRLAARDPEKRKKLYGWLFGAIFDELVAEEDGALDREPLPAGELTFNPARENDSDPSAYALVGSKAVLGSNSRVVKQLAGCVESRNCGLGGNALFAKLRGRIPAEAHGFIFIDNSDQRFRHFLRNYEQELDRSMLRAAELMDAMMMTFTLVDQDHLTGKMWMVPLDGISVEVLQEGARSFDGMVCDEFSRINLGFTSTVVSGEDALEIEFTVEDLREPSEKP